MAMANKRGVVNGVMAGVCGAYGARRMWRMWLHTANVTAVMSSCRARHVSSIAYQRNIMCIW